MPDPTKPTVASVLRDDVAQAKASVKAKLAAFLAAHPFATHGAAFGLGAVLVEVARRVL